jgi:methyl-accepting chemotaxis protein
MRRAQPAETPEDDKMDATIIYANLAGYLTVASGGMIIGTLFGSRVHSSLNSMMRGLETRIAAVETAANAVKAAAASAAVVQPVHANNRQAEAIEAHTAAVNNLAGAIERHANAINNHGAATVAAAFENHPVAGALNGPETK